MDSTVRKGADAVGSIVGYDDGVESVGHEVWLMVRDRPNDGSGNIVVLKQDAVDGRKSTNMTGQPLICWLRA